MSNLKNAVGVITGDGQTQGIEVLVGPCAIFLEGVFDGATVTLESPVGDSGFVPVLDGTTPVTYTQSNGAAYNLFTGQNIRFSTTGSGGSTSIHYQLSYN